MPTHSFVDKRALICNPPDATLRGQNRHHRLRPQGHSPLSSPDDIWRVANLMLKRYGDKAEAESARRADELAADGADTGVAVWMRIIEAIGQLANTTPTGPVHLPDRSDPQTNKVVLWVAQSARRIRREHLEQCVGRIGRNLQ